MSQSNAVAASSFSASIGINTHLDQWWTSYNDTKLVISSLEYLDVGKVRDSLAAPNDVALFGSVAAAAHVQFDAYLSLSGLSYDAEIAEMRAVAGILASVEGINEGDAALSRMSYAGLTGYAAIAAAQAALYVAIRSDPATSGLTVIGPSYGDLDDFASALNVASVSDAGNNHEYFGTGNPPGAGIGRFMAQTALVAGSNPDVATEAGYYTGTSLSGSAEIDAAYRNSGVSQLVAAKYDLTLLFDDWKHGIQATYLYELLDRAADPGNTDSEDHYGLFEADGTPKVAATAIHNLMTILADGGPARTDTFGYQVVGAPSTGNSLLLEKSTGVFDLAVWNDIRLSDSVTGAELATPAVPGVVSFGQTVRTVSEYDPLAGTGAIRTWSNVDAVSLDLLDHPVLLEITPYPPSQLSLRSFVLPETVASGASSADLRDALVANATETDRSALATVRLVAVGTAGTDGSVRFDPAAQTVVYTAPTYSPLDPADGFTYTLADAQGNTVAGKVAITETPPPDTLYGTVAGARLVAPADGWSLVSLAANEELYSEKSGTTFVGGADTRMYGGGAGNVFTAGDGTHSLGAGDDARITLGDGDNTIGLHGSGAVVVTGNGNNLMWKSTGDTSITTGNGNQTITVGGRNNVVTVGRGDSTIVAGADGAPAGNERVTVGRGVNSVTVDGTGDTVTAEGGANRVIALGSQASVTLEDGQNDVSSMGAGSGITARAGINFIETSGSGDVITLGTGWDTVWASGDGVRITAGSGAATITFIGQHDTIDVSHGVNTVTAQGVFATLVLGAAGATSTQIYGNVIAALDTLDLRAALAPTSWNGNRNTLSDYLVVRQAGGASVISIDADGKGSGAPVDVAILRDTANLTYAGLLAHAILV